MGELNSVHTFYTRYFRKNGYQPPSWYQTHVRKFEERPSVEELRYFLETGNFLDTMPWKRGVYTVGEKEPGYRAKEIDSLRESSIPRSFSSSRRPGWSGLEFVGCHEDDKGRATVVLVMDADARVRSIQCVRRAARQSAIEQQDEILAHRVLHAYLGEKEDDFR